MTIIDHSMSRRAFLGAAGAGALAGARVTAAPASAAAPRKAPFKVLYSNDTTNIVSCPSPFKRREEPFGDKHLRSSVAETAGKGVDVHLLQPGLGWVPWWPSEVLPMSQHVAWLKAKGDKPSSFENFVLNGGDLVRVFIDACRACGQTPFISIRLNDAHHIYRGMAAKPEAREKALAEFQFFADHPDCRIGPDAEGGERMQYMLDWGRPEVRAYKLRLIEELCATYDFEGLELDFMRHWIFFNLKKTTAEQRRAIQLDVVRQVRQLLDRHAQPGRRRWLCVRVPSHPETYDATGIDLAAFAAAGVEMVNASSHYFTDCQLELAEMRRQLPGSVALYAEVQFVSATSQRVTAPDGKASIPVNRRTTPEQFNTVAHQAYAQGADGVSAFNFQYYRGTYSPTDVYGTPAEPPFGVFRRLGDRAWLAQQPQHYFVGQGQGHPKLKGRPFQDLVQPGATASQALTLAPPAGGWQKGGRLRIQARAPLGDSRWSATLNGVALEPTPDVSEPYPTAYPVGLGQPEDYRAWTVPAALLQAGVNEIAVTLERGQTSTLMYLDLAVS
jgi:hypothetical protein